MKHWHALALCLLAAGCSDGSGGGSKDTDHTVHVVGGYSTWYYGPGYYGDWDDDWYYVPPGAGQKPPPDKPQRPGDRPDGPGARPEHPIAEPGRPSQPGGARPARPTVRPATSARRMPSIPSRTRPARRMGGGRRR